MALPEICRWLHDSPLGAAMRDTLFPRVEALHVLAISMVVGSIAIVDLRLLGWASRERPINRLVGEVLPITWSAFTVAVLTGLALFASDATGYYGNFSFRMKMLAMALAGVNMALFHFATYRNVAGWDDAPRTPLAARFAGGLSLGLWIAVVVFGRWIGFTVKF